MIKCPKCGSEHISIVTEVKSEKQEEWIISFIQTFAILIFIISAIAFLIHGFNDLNTFSYILEGKADIATTLDLSAGLLSDILFLNNIWKVTKTSFLIVFITGIIKLLLPYRTYSERQYICNKCEHEWKRNNVEQNPS